MALERLQQLPCDTTTTTHGTPLNTHPRPNPLLHKYTLSLHTPPRSPALTQPIHSHTHGPDRSHRSTKTSQTTGLRDKPKHCRTELHHKQNLRPLQRLRSANHWRLTTN